LFIVVLADKNGKTLTKREYKYIEMENIKVSQDGFRLDAELKNVPVSFVNGMRRIILSEIPTVVVTNVQILDNTTQMTHEMLRPRVEMLPVNVLPTEVEVIRDAKLELRFLKANKEREVTSDDFVVGGTARNNVLLHDKMLGTPMLFMNLKPEESLHIKANLAIAPTGFSQVCVSTYKLHIDETLAKRDRDAYTKQAPNDERSQKIAEREFDNLMIQRSYSRDPATERPNWFDFAVESIGVMKAKDLVKSAMEIYKGKIDEFVKTDVQREEDSWYRMEVENETFTLGALVQEILYTSKVVDYVSYNIGHPLRPKLVLRFKTTSQPEVVVEKFKTEALALCENVLKSV
jgi:DNA-directed RNA polymerase subunit L